MAGAAERLGDGAPVAGAGQDVAGEREGSTASSFETSPGRHDGGKVEVDGGAARRREESGGGVLWSGRELGSGLRRRGKLR